VYQAAAARRLNGKLLSSPLVCSRSGRVKRSASPAAIEASLRVDGSQLRVLISYTSTLRAHLHYCESNRETGARAEVQKKQGPAEGSSSSCASVQGSAGGLGWSSLQLYRLTQATKRIAGDVDEANPEARSRSLSFCRSLLISSSPAAAHWSAAQLCCTVPPLPSIWSPQVGCGTAQVETSADSAPTSAANRASSLQLSNYLTRESRLVDTSHCFLENPSQTRRKLTRSLLSSSPGNRLLRLSRGTSTPPHPALLELEHHAPRRTLGELSTSFFGVAS
jgi:hypothetical protein